MFSQWVVACRQRRGMTQDELAERSGLSVRTIRDVESGRVHTPRASTVRLLADAFGLCGAEREQFILRKTSSPVPQQVLPIPLTSFVGRGAEIVELVALARANRLVTVTGAGGVGKSRLAAAVAAELTGGFPAGTWLIELAALAQTDLVASAMASAAGIRGHPNRPPLEILTEHLGNRPVLLVLDNCEHLVAAVADVACRVLRCCAGVRILATSRERLGVTGEVVREISGLGVPAQHAAGVAAIGSADAVRLLVERTVALDPRFTLTDANADAVAHICRSLDGIPLAIELAAATVRTLGAAPVAARLDNMFGLLALGDRISPQRHRTLRAVIDWSYQLLDTAQRRLFDQLSVFTGGFTLAAAEAVNDSTVDDPRTVAVVLAQLVEKSLVTVDNPGAVTPRYRMLETLRSYGVMRLAEQGATAAARDRHTTYVLAMVQSARQAMRDGDGPAWLQQLETEHSNIRAALQWSLETSDTLTAVQLVSSLYPLWDRHGHYQDGRRWLGLLRLTLTTGIPVSPATRAQALDYAAGLAIIQGDLAEATAASGEAAALSRQIGDATGVARAGHDRPGRHVRRRPRPGRTCTRTGALHRPPDRGPPAGGHRLALPHLCGGSTAGLRTRHAPW